MKSRTTHAPGSIALAILWCAGAAAAVSTTAVGAAAVSATAVSATAVSAAAAESADAGPPGGPALAPLWTVHIDEVRADKAAEFERLAIEENRRLHAILREHGQPITPAFEIVTTGGVYISLRAKTTFAELDAPSTVPEDVRKLLKAVTDPLDAPIHAALKYHHNEIWRYQKDGSYVPETSGPALSAPGYIQVVSERVIPGMEDKYGTLLDALNVALKKSRYPWRVLMFSSSYGDGAYKSLWQAESKAAFIKAGDRAAVLTAVLGKEAAARALADWKSCLAGFETADAAARRDYTDLADSVPWLGPPSQ
jgi:hypothetical protein